MRPTQPSLLADEAIIYRTGLHWVSFWLSLLMILFFGLPGLFFLVGGIYGLFTKDSSAEAFSETGILSLGWTAFVLTRAILRKRAAQFLVTNKRVIFQTGLLRLQRLVVPLEEIESVSVLQSGFASLLRYGTVTIETKGGTVEHFSFVSRAQEFRTQVCEQIGWAAARRGVLAT